MARDHFGEAIIVTRSAPGRRFERPATLAPLDQVLEFGVDSRIALDCDELDRGRREARDRPRGRGTEIRMFSPTGVHLRTLGRSGDGPGELQRLDQVFVLVTSPSSSVVAMRGPSGARTAI